jgi:predicted nucleic acid-binding protein
VRKVFADTLYWIAVVKPNDPYAPAAREARQALGPCLLVTTDEVLGEFLTAFARSGSNMRARAVRTVRDILDSAEVQVVIQSRQSFLGAMARFSQRLDKEYSLTDCSSMNVMGAEGITDILTNDHHFQQEGYNVLIRALPGGRGSHNLG